MPLDPLIEHALQLDALQALAGMAGWGWHAMTILAGMLCLSWPEVKRPVRRPFWLAAASARLPPLTKPHHISVGSHSASAVRVEKLLRPGVFKTRADIAVWACRRTDPARRELFGRYLQASLRAGRLQDARSELPFVRRAVKWASHLPK